MVFLTGSGSTGLIESGSETLAPEVSVPVPQHCTNLTFFFSDLQISRESIDACKDYFRDELQKTDWVLMVELKKLFEIL
jgi:hypothetical protein